MVYDCIHNNTPYSLSNMFIKTSQISARTTRSSINTNNLYISRYRTNKLQRSIRYQGVKIWNSIPSDIQKLPKRHFIRKLKSHLLQTYNLPSNNLVFPSFSFFTSPDITLINFNTASTTVTFGSEGWLLDSMTVEVCSQCPSG